MLVVNYFFSASARPGVSFSRLISLIGADWEFSEESRIICYLVLPYFYHKVCVFKLKKLLFVARLMTVNLIPLL
jgi:hypothetical protein